MPITPYLYFNGRADEAVAFYRKALGADVVLLMRYGESPLPAAPGMLPPGSDDKVMHMTLQVGDALLMGSDGRCGGDSDFRGFAVSLTVPDVAAAERAFAALSDGGEVQMPLAETFFAPRFGMVADRFWVAWMVLVAH
jgi:PhnB protein